MLRGKPVVEGAVLLEERRDIEIVRTAVDTLPTSIALGMNAPSIYSRLM